MTLQKRQDAYSKGIMAEYFSIIFLYFRGYRCVARRAKTPLGEIDLIFIHKDSLVFVEVKARQSLEDALSACQPSAQKRIVRAAQYWMTQYQQKFKTQTTTRIGFFAFQSPFVWRYIDNAWY
jgi:putative endonuclease